jgi:uncharacterized protein (DUF2141 family)
VAPVNRAAMRTVLFPIAIGLLLPVVMAAQQYQQFNIAPQFSGGMPLAAGDFNGDGKDDFVGLTTTSQIRIALSNGSTFVFSRLYSVAGGPFAAAVGDFNGDGKLDIAVTCGGAASGFGGTGVLSILLGNGDGTFQAHLDSPVPKYPFGIALGDLNGDGKLDAVVVGNIDPNLHDPPALISVLLGNGDGTFQPHVDYEAGTPGFLMAAQSPVIADLNGDGKLDVVLLYSGSVNVLLKRAPGKRRWHAAGACGLSVRVKATVAQRKTEQKKAQTPNDSEFKHRTWHVGGRRP